MNTWARTYYRRRIRSPRLPPRIRRGARLRRHLVSHPRKARNNSSRSPRSRRQAPYGGRRPKCSGPITRLNEAARARASAASKNSPPERDETPVARGLGEAAQDDGQHAHPTADPTAPQAKRGRGRPPGSKNKPKAATPTPQWQGDSPRTRLTLSPVARAHLEALDAMHPLDYDSFLDAVRERVSDRDNAVRQAAQREVERWQAEWRAERAAQESAAIAAAVERGEPIPAHLRPPGGLCIKCLRGLRDRESRRLGLDAGCRKRALAKSGRK